MSGYSKTKLIDKLGIKPGFKIYILNSPRNYFDMLGKLPVNIIKNKKLQDNLDFIHFFTKEKKILEENFQFSKIIFHETDFYGFPGTKVLQRLRPT